MKTQPSKSIDQYISMQLKEDSDNYVKCSIQGGPPKLKKAVVPHIFLCQTKRYQSFINTKRPAVQKLTRKRVINEIFLEQNQKENRFENDIELEYKTENNSKLIKLNNDKSKNVLGCITNTVNILFYFSATSLFK